MGKRSAVVELFLGDMGSIQRELRPSTQREDQLTMETKLEQIAVKGPVAELVGIEGGVVSGVINLESSGVEASDWRPRHDEQYYEA